MFQRMIGIPPPDYGTRFTMWDHFIRQATRTAQYTMTPAELTNLARISDSYTPGSIARSVSEVTNSFHHMARQKKEQLFSSSSFLFFEYCDVTDIERATETAVATSIAASRRVRVGPGPLRAHLQVNFPESNSFRVLFFFLQSTFCVCFSSFLNSFSLSISIAFSFL